MQHFHASIETISIYDIYICVCVRDYQPIEYWEQFTIQERQLVIGVELLQHELHQSFYITHIDVTP